MHARPIGEIFIILFLYSINVPLLTGHSNVESTDKQMFDAHTHMLKELCDLVYVAVGTSVSFGYSFDDGFKSVHTSNMTKDGNINSNGKITKGPSYKGPEELGMYINGRV